jgi:hypothetical protein
VWLAAVVERAMRRDPAERYESAGAFADDLARWRRRDAARRRPARRPSASPRRRAALALVVALAAGALLGLRAPARSVSAEPRQAPELGERTTNSELEAHHLDPSEEQVVRELMKDALALERRLASALLHEKRKR